MRHLLLALSQKPLEVITGVLIILSAFTLTYLLIFISAVIR